MGSAGVPVALLSAFISNNFQTNVLPGANIIFDQLATPVAGTSFTYNPATGVITFLTAGTYELTYGVSYGSGGSTAIIKNAATQTGSEYTKQFLAGDVDMIVVSMLVTAAPGDVMSIQNTDGINTLILISALPGIQAYIILRQVA